MAGPMLLVEQDDDVLSPADLAESRRLIEQCKEIQQGWGPGSAPTKYAPSSENTLHFIQKRWKRYCSLVHKNPVEMLREFEIPFLYTFFRWLFEKDTSISTSTTGRKRKAGAVGTLQTYWNVLCTARRREFESQLLIDHRTKNQMQGVRDRLAGELELRSKPKEKPLVRVEDLFNLLNTLWSSPDVCLDHERLRVQLALIIQLAGATGNRPTALVSLTYDDLKIFLLPDPAGGERPRILIELTFRNTKGYLGDKPANTFPLVDLPGDSCLLLCSSVLMLSLVLADKAFAARSLTSPEELFKIQVSPHARQQKLTFKDSMAGVPLFRRAVAAASGRTISDSRAVTSGWLGSQLKKLGAVAGFELPLGAYAFRRGAGEAMDNSSHVSDSLRNLILLHSDSTVFQRNYLSRYVTQDTQAIYRGVEPQTAVIRLASGMSRTIDTRRPRALNDSQLAATYRHPEVKLLKRRRDRLLKDVRAQHGTASRARGTPAYERYLSISRAFESKKKELRRTALLQIKARYEKEQPVIDIQRQVDIRHAEEAEPECSANATRQLSPWRMTAWQSLLTVATVGAAEDQQRRTTAIQAISLLCQRQEPRTNKVCRRKGNTPKADVAADTRAATPPLVCQRTQCIFCVGEHSLAIENRLHAFHSKGDLKKHFGRAHLKHLPDNQPIKCPHPRCEVTLRNKAHLQRHAAEVHGTVT